MLENEQLQGKITIKKCVENEMLILLFSLPVIVIERRNIGVMILCILPALSYLISIIKLHKGKEIAGLQYILHNGIFAGCFTVIFALDGLEVLLYLFSGTERSIAIFIVSAGYVFMFMIWGFIVRQYRKREYNKAKKIKGRSFFGLFGVTGILVARTLSKNIDNNTAWEIVCACCFLVSYLSLGGIFNIFQFQYIKKHPEIWDEQCMERMERKADETNKK